MPKRKSSKVAGGGKKSKAQIAAELDEEDLEEAFTFFGEVLHKDGVEDKDNEQSDDGTNDEGDGGSDGEGSSGTEGIINDGTFGWNRYISVSCKGLRVAPSFPTPQCKGP